MARTAKRGLDYFPLDVGFLRNIKIRKLIKDQGIQASIIHICLLSNIYEHKGYYIEWEGDETAFFIADQLSGVKEAAVKSTVLKSVAVGLFDQRLFSQYKILTSRSIQEQYLKIVKSSKRKSIEIDERFALIFENSGKTPENSVINPLNSGSNTINSVRSTQRKEKERKEKEIKEEKSKSDHSLFNEIVEDYTTYCFGKVDSISLERVRTTVQEYGDTWVQAAMSIAYGANKASWGYVEGILRSWASKYNLDDEPWKIERGNIGGANRTKPNNQYTPEYYEGDAEQL